MKGQETHPWVISGRRRKFGVSSKFIVASAIKVADIYPHFMSAIVELHARSSTPSGFSQQARFSCYITQIATGGKAGIILFQPSVFLLRQVSILNSPRLLHFSRLIHNLKSIPSTTPDKPEPELPYIPWPKYGANGSRPTVHHSLELDKKKKSTSRRSCRQHLPSCPSVHKSRPVAKPLNSHWDHSRNVCYHKSVDEVRCTAIG